MKKFSQILVSPHPNYDVFHAIDSLVFPSDSLHEKAYENLTDTIIHFSMVHDSVIGYSVLAKDSENSSAHLKRLGVMPEYRKQGAASALLRENIIYAKKHSLRKMTLNVIQDNQAAINLYKKFGFEVSGESAQYEYSEVLADETSERTLYPVTQLPEAANVPLPCPFQAGEPDILFYFVHDNSVRGCCVFDPVFPGCNKFSVRDAKYDISPVLSELLARRKESDRPVKITTPDAASLAIFKAMDLKKNYGLFNMKLTLEHACM